MERGQKFTNPFFPEDISRREPELSRSNPLKEELQLTIRDMEQSLFPYRDAIRHIPDSVLDLSVQDLNDLAAQISGIDSHNPTAKGLTFEDLRGIEAVFFEAKSVVLEKLGERGVTVAELRKAEDDEIYVPCCCCTPCCCCAAVDVDPFEEPVVAFAR